MLMMVGLLLLLFSDITINNHIDNRSRGSFRIVAARAQENTPDADSTLIISLDDSGRGDDAGARDDDSARKLPPVLSCFSGMNTVLIHGTNDPIPLRQLKVGDYVQVGSDEYSQVYSFGHYDHDKEATFVQIRFEDNNDASLELSTQHLVFTSNHQLKTVSEVIVGDSLLGDKQERVVQSVQRVIRRGVYAPLTKSGNIVVSGVIASNFVKMLHHDVGVSVSSWPNHHYFGKTYMYPYQLFCSYFMKQCQEETYYDGYSYYVYNLVKIGEMIEYFGRIAPTVIWLISVPLVSIVYLLDLSTSSFLIMAAVFGTL